jgi:hypothetical protein
METEHAKEIARGMLLFGRGDVVCCDGWTFERFPPDDKRASLFPEIVGDFVEFHRDDWERSSSFFYRNSEGEEFLVQKVKIIEML